MTHIILALLISLIAFSNAGQRKIGLRKNNLNRGELQKRLYQALAEDTSIDSDRAMDYATYLDTYYDGNYDVDDKRALRERYKLYRRRIRRLSNISPRKKNMNGREFDQQYGDTIFLDWTDEEIEGIFEPINDEVQVRRRLSYTKECDQWSGKKRANLNGNTLDVMNKCNAPIKIQGPYSTCWIFGILTQAECNYNIQRGESSSFSAQHTLDCTDDYVGSALNGGKSHRLTDWATDSDNPQSGYCSDYEYEYDGTDYSDSCDECYSLQKPIACVELSDPTNHDRLFATSTKYALTFSINVPKDFVFLKGRGATFYGCDYNGDENNNNTIIGSHSMAIVGQYDGKLLKVKNSWTDLWGDDGYFWMDPDAITESCKREPIKITMDYFGPN